jgi:fatty acid desaturase
MASLVSKMHQIHANASKKGGKVTQKEENGAILRMVLGFLLFVGGLALLFLSFWYLIPAIIGFFLTLYSFFAYIVIREDPDNPRLRK